jgi:hypothetical protein
MSGRRTSRPPATALLMQRFYANLLGKREGLKRPMSKAALVWNSQEERILITWPTLPTISRT